MSADGTPSNVLAELRRKGLKALKKKKRAPRKNVQVSELAPYNEDLKEDLYIGNLHHLSTGNRNSHVWTMFISTDANEVIPPNSVEKVEYELHPTFHPPKVTVTEPPFYVQRRGWGYFQVYAQIWLKNSSSPSDASNDNNDSKGATDAKDAKDAKGKKGKKGGKKRKADIRVAHMIHFGLPLVCHSCEEKFENISARKRQAAVLPHCSNSPILQKLVIQQTKKYHLRGETLKKLNANRRRCFVLTQNNGKLGFTTESAESKQPDPADDPDDDGPDNESISVKKNGARLALAFTNHGAAKDQKEDEIEAQQDEKGGYKQHLVRMLKRGIVSKRIEDVPTILIENRSSMLLEEFVNLLMSVTDIPKDVARVIAIYANKQVIEFTTEEVMSQIPQLTHITIRGCVNHSVVIANPICVLKIENCENCQIHFDSVERCVSVKNCTDCELFCGGMVPAEPEDEESDDQTDPHATAAMRGNNNNNNNNVQERRRARQLNDMRYFRPSDLQDTTYGTYTHRIERSSGITTFMQDPANRHTILYLSIYSEHVTHRIYEGDVCIKQWTNFDDEETHQEIANNVKQLTASKAPTRSKNDKPDVTNETDGMALAAGAAPMAPARIEEDEEAVEENERIYDRSGTNFWGKEKSVMVRWRDDEHKRKFGMCLVLDLTGNMMEALD